MRVTASLAAAVVLSGCSAGGPRVTASASPSLGSTVSPTPTVATTPTEPQLTPVSAVFSTRTQPVSLAQLQDAANKALAGSAWLRGRFTILDGGVPNDLKLLKDFPAQASDAIETLAVDFYTAYHDSVEKGGAPAGTDLLYTAYVDCYYFATEGPWKKSIADLQTELTDVLSRPQPVDIYTP